MKRCFFLVLLGLPLLAACSGAQENLRDEGREAMDAIRRACLEGEPAQQLAACRRALKLSPEDWEVEFRLGQLLVDSNITEALAHLNRVAAVRPQDGSVICTLGLARKKRGDQQGAITSLQECLKLDSTNCQARLELCDLLRKTGQREEARRQLEEQLKQRPDDAQAWYQLSLTLMALGDKEKAIEAARRLVELKPQDPNARSNLGLFLNDAGRPQQAIEHLQKAVELEPTNATAYYNLGLAYTSSELYEEAARNFDTALRLRPDFAQAHHNLAVIFMALGLCKTAGGYFERSWALGVKSTEVVLEQFRKRCQQPEGESSSQDASN